MTQRLWTFSWIWLTASCLFLAFTIIHINRIPAKSGAAPDKNAGAGQAVTAKPAGLRHKTSPIGHQANITTGLTEESADQSKAISGLDEKLAELAKQGKWDELIAGLSVKTNIVVGKEKEVDYTPVDLSGAGGTQSKIEKILERFKDAAGYQKPNELVNQIIALGEDAIEPLLAMWQECKDEHAQWATRMAIEDALKGLLTEKHRDLIVKYFNEQNLFADLIKKYGFKEAEEPVMARLIKWEGGGSDDANALVDAALKYDGARAVEILMAKMKEGYIIGNAAERLASVPGLDMTDTFRQAAEKVQGNWEREKLLTPMMEKGMRESVDLALKILQAGRSGGSIETDNYLREKVCRQISNYIGVIGTTDEITAWLENNRNNLVWNPNTRHFEPRGGK